MDAVHTFAHRGRRRLHEVCRHPRRQVATTSWSATRPTSPSRTRLKTRHTASATRPAREPTHCPSRSPSASSTSRRTGGDRRGAGYVGQITANSFMKREFGKKLIEHFFAQKVDLTHVIDTSGAYIPGHGTPTVILVWPQHDHRTGAHRSAPSWHPWRADLSPKIRRKGTCGGRSSDRDRRNPDQRQRMDHGRRSTAQSTRLPIPGASAAAGQRRVPEPIEAVSPALADQVSRDRILAR